MSGKHVCCIVLSVLAGCGAPVEQGGRSERPLFSGPYEMQNWSSSGILGGETTITPDSGASDWAEFGYDVALSGGGVSYREATFSTTAVASGQVGFDWHWDFYHAWYMVHANLYVFADSSSGRTTVPLLEFYNPTYTGPQSFDGSGTITVEAGHDFGFIVGGSNYDSHSVIQGTVKIIPWDADADGVPNGSDTCPDTPWGAVVNASGCSIAQLCPCGDAWKNHGQYVSCVAAAAGQLLADGLISDADKDAEVSAAATSDCGQHTK